MADDGIHESEAIALVDGDPGRKSRFSIPRLSLSLSAFIMSLTITLIGAYYALQGAEILVRPPEQVVLYRDGQGKDAVLGVALRVDMINSASSYGDVMLEAELVPHKGAPSFRYQGVVTPVFTDGAEKAAAGCELGSRCIALPGLLLVERSDQLMDIPGGGARVMNLAFPLADWNCRGPAKLCQSYGTFNNAVAAISAHSISPTLAIRFHADGNRTIICKGGRVDTNYLKQVGWLSLSCNGATVTGEPLF